MNRLETYVYIYRYRYLGIDRYRYTNIDLYMHSLCVLSFRLAMRWESLWRKQSCTTGMTWIFRTWWTPSRKRSSSGRLLRNTHQHDRVHSVQNGSTKTGKAAVSVGSAAVCSFWPRPHAPTRFLCTAGTPRIRYHTPICTVWHAGKPGFSPREKPTLAGGTAGWSNGVFLLLNINPVPCSFSPSSCAAGGTTTQTGRGTCTLIARRRTPATSAAPCLIPAAFRSPERCVRGFFFLLAFALWHPVCWEQMKTLFVATQKAGIGSSRQEKRRVLAGK